ncbi:dUTPase family protein [Clostridium botulinum]|uniref:dUTPase n=1 Tax=Clostridium botulinum TaxID=1491 RepID=UPI000FCB05E9|nr:dUTPase [Clostridium botulinum]RUT53369.1 dUTPase family protein [Clostridium botulinum]
MEFKDLLEKQRRLDEFITKKYDPLMKQKDFLVYRLLALQVEVSELANSTRSFKYWSDKGSEPKERVLDEYADVLHFLLSVGHTLDFTAKEIEEAYLKKHKENYRRQREGY